MPLLRLVICSPSLTSLFRDLEASCKISWALRILVCSEISSGNLARQLLLSLKQLLERLINRQLKLRLLADRLSLSLTSLFLVREERFRSSWVLRILACLVHSLNSLVKRSYRSLRLLREMWIKLVLKPPLLLDKLLPNLIAIFRSKTVGCKLYLVSRI